MLISQKTEQQFWPRTGYDIRPRSRICKIGPSLSPDEPSHSQWKQLEETSYLVKIMSLAGHSPGSEALACSPAPAPGTQAFRLLPLCDRHSGDCWCSRKKTGPEAQSLAPDLCSSVTLGASLADSVLQLPQAGFLSSFLH